MDIFLNDEFLAWFFTYFNEAAICSHCQVEIYDDEVIENGKEYIVCPHCGKKITRGDLG